LVFFRKKSFTRHRPKHPDQARILISRLSAHGDVVQTLPLLSAIKQEMPFAFVGWVVEESAAPLLENHPSIDRLHVFPLKRWSKALKHPTQWVSVLSQGYRFIREISAQGYAIGFDVQGLLKSAILLWLAGIPRRLGYEATREGAALFYTEVLPYHDIKNPHLPTVVKFAEFAEAVGCTQVPRFEATTPNGPQWQQVQFVVPPATEATQQRVKALLSPAKPDLPVIAVAPATIWPSKHWHEDYWPEILNHLETLPVTVVLLGTKGDRALTERLLKEVPEFSGIDLVGETSLVELYEVFRHVDILIGLDSAPLHIANAVGHPLIIGLYGPTGRIRTGPVGAQHLALATDLSCQPCFKRTCPLETHACMTELVPNQVKSAIETQLAKVFERRVSV
jgi:lipopolysaccharide heptosyltransferase II